MTTQAFFQVSYVDNQLVAYLNGERIYTSKDMHGPEDGKAIYISEKLVPGSNQLLFVGINGGGEARFNVQLFVDGILQGPEIEYYEKNPGKYVVYDHCYVITAK